MKFIKRLLLFSHISILFLLLGVLLNSVVSPKTFPYLNLLSLAFPSLIILHGILSLFWIVIRDKKAIFFLLISLIFINPTRRWVNFTINQDEPTFRIMTFNIANNSKKKGKIISDFLKDKNYDVIMLQESGHKGINIPKSTLKNEITEYYLTAFYTKHPVLDRGEILDSSNYKFANAMYADVEINGRGIRFINLYLNPFSLEKKKIDVEEDLADNKNNAKYLLRKMIPNFKRHQKSIEKIKPFIENSPYPVVLGGDFNAVPNSYEYYQLSEKLNDAFVKSGKGFGTSFHDLKVPIRIDYIFASDEIIPVQYKIDRSVKLSDHYPVIAEFKIANKK